MRKLFAPSMIIFLALSASASAEPVQLVPGWIARIQPAFLTLLKERPFIYAIDVLNEKTIADVNRAVLEIEELTKPGTRPLVTGSMLLQITISSRSQMIQSEMTRHQWKKPLLTSLETPIGLSMIHGMKSSLSSMLFSSKLQDVILLVQSFYNGLQESKHFSEEIERTNLTTSAVEPYIGPNDFLQFSEFDDFAIAGDLSGKSYSRYEFSWNDAFKEVRRLESEFKNIENAGTNPLSLAKLLTIAVNFRNFVLWQNLRDSHSIFRKSQNFLRVLNDCILSLINDKVSLHNEKAFLEKHFELKSQFINDQHLKPIDIQSLVVSDVALLIHEVIRFLKLGEGNEYLLGPEKG